MKPQPPKEIEKLFPYPKIHGNICLWCQEKDTEFPCWKYHSVCPVQVGDIFYVRETWGIDCICARFQEDDFDHSLLCVNYRADITHPDAIKSWEGHWHPSTNMPKKYARTRKQVTGIRVEHGPEIREEDAIAEGFGSADAFEKWWVTTYGDDKPWRWVYELGEVGK